MQVDTQHRPNSASLGDFVPLAARMLQCLDLSSIDLYFWNEAAERPVLFHPAGTKLDSQKAANLLNQGGEALYLKIGDFQDICDGLFGSLEAMIADETFSPTDRFQMLQTALTFEVEKSLNSIDPGKYLALVDRVSGLIRGLVVENSVHPADLFAIAKHDAHTLAHATNVTGYASVLAVKLGICAPAELDHIAVGAMLHDIGKRFIPQTILSKPARLDPEERLIIQTHPLRGYEELVCRESLNHAQLMMVYQHHERIDGTGYPVRILADEIHPWARLLSVVDVFDALTGKRPYRRAMSLKDATQFVADRAGSQFDKDMAKCWISAIKIR